MKFSDLLQRVYRALGQFNASTATGGTTTTVVDTKQVEAQGEDDAWKDGTLFIIRDSAGASAAPEGQFQRIDSYDDSAGTFTADTAFTVSPAVGDRYGFTNNIFPLHDMIEICNDALTDLGPVPLADTTTLDTVASQTEYDYAVAWKFRPPLAIDIQGVTDDSNDNLWYPPGYYRIIPAAAGSASTLELIPQPTASRDIRVMYLATHSRLNAYSDTVSEFIFPTLAVAACAFAAIDNYINLSGGGDDENEKMFNKLAARLQEAKRDFPIWKPTRKQKVLRWPQ
jgi:hypothetical protein